MNSKMKVILQSLVEQAKKNKDFEASYDLIAIASNNEQVENVVSQLENKGLITSVSIYGKTYFSCKLTEKAFKYFEKEKFNKN